MAYKNLGLAELDELLAEIRAIYTETDINSKKDLLVSLQGVRADILVRNNLYEMKIAHAKQVAGDKYRCEFVVNTDDVTSQYVIFHNAYSSIDFISKNTVHFIYSDVFTSAIQVSLFDLISSTTEDLAWLEFYNKRIAETKTK